MKLSIIVLNYNGIDLLKKYFYSVVEQDYQDKEIILVDNGSTDGSAEYIESKYPQVKVIKADKNYGVSSGYNIGALVANGEYIFFLANDMRLRKNVSSIMMNLIDGVDSRGIVTCKTIRMDSNIIDSFGCKLDIFGFPKSIGLGDIDYGQYDYTLGYTDFSFGACLLMPRKLFYSVGCYNDNFHSVYDDFDLSWRVRARGYDIAISPFAVIEHVSSPTMKKNFDKSYIRYLSERNMYLMLLRNLGLRRLLWVMPCCVVMTLLEVIIRLCRREWKTAYKLLSIFYYLVVNSEDILKGRKKAREITNDSMIYKTMYLGSYKILNWLKGEA